jgi:3-oxo-5-alpha-steroid 4-dehydrogenase 3
MRYWHCAERASPGHWIKHVLPYCEQPIVLLSLNRQRKISKSLKLGRTMEGLIHQSIDLMSILTPAQWCQTFFALSTAIVLGIQALPQDVRSALMDYGARRPKDARHGEEQEVNRQKALVPLSSFMKNLTEYGQVPHSWFLHFYIVSVALSGFWAWQYLTKGHVLRNIATWQSRAGGPSMTLEQAFVAWLLMALQGSRRLCESLLMFKPGPSPMWFIHWALGLSYYIAMSLAVWVEGSSTFSIFTPGYGRS